MKFIFFITVIFSQLGHAIASEESNYQFLSDYSLNRFGENVISPVTESSGQVSLLIGSFLTSALLVSRDQTVNPMQEHWSEAKPMGSLSKFGDIMGQTVPNAIYGLGMLLHHAITDSNKSYYRTMYMIEATAYSALTTLVLKNVIHETRPSGSDNYSFPSGHTTTAFAFATVIAEEHSLYYSVPAYALATLVGLSRINDNAHYLHDVVFGATVGITYGLALSQLNISRGKNNFEKNETAKWWLFPSDDLKGMVFSMSYKF